MLDEITQGCFQVVDEHFQSPSKIETGVWFTESDSGHPLVQKANDALQLIRLLVPGKGCDVSIEK